MSEPLAQAARQGGGSMTIFGVVTIVLGILAMMAPMLVGFSVAMLIGIILLAAGITRMFWAFKAETFGRGALKFAIGGLTLLSGLVLLARPLFALGTLTVVLALYFIVDGFFEVIGAFQLKPANGWGWVLFGGLISLALGVMIWRQFPLSGAWAIGILVGVKLIFAGIMMVTVGSVVRSAASAATEG